MLNEQRKSSKSGKVEDTEPLLDWESYYVLVGEVSKHLAFDSCLICMVPFTTEIMIAHQIKSICMLPNF